MVELAVGSLTYTSSDESDFSEDENGERYLTGYLVLLKLPWERSRMTKAKKASVKTGSCKAISTLPAYWGTGMGG